jgi:hypothetical protein
MDGLFYIDIFNINLIIFILCGLCELCERVIRQPEL